MNEKFWDLLYRSTAALELLAEEAKRPPTDEQRGEALRRQIAKEAMDHALLAEMQQQTKTLERIAEALEELASRH